MAAPSSTFHCHSAIKSSISSSTFSSYNLYDYSVRRRSISCCSSFSTSLTCCRSSSSGDPQEGKIRVKRSPERNVIAPIDKKSKNENTLSMNNVGSKNRSIGFKDIFERRSLWRRIFFASKKVRSIILLNVITIIYASNIPVVKEVEAFVDPEIFTVVRFVFSAIPFFPFVLQARHDIQTRNAGIELGIWVSLGYLMQALGLLTSDAGRACFISMFTVIVVPLLDGMLGSTIPARTWFGALMSIVGVGMLESSGSPPCVGDLFNFLSAVFFGIHMLRTEHISRSISKDNFLPLLGYEVCVVAVFSSIWCLIGGLTGGIEVLNPSSWTWATFWEWTVTFPWVPALYTGIFSTGLCLWIEIAAMRDVSATDTAIIYGLEPVWGAGFAWFLLGERWGIHGWIGAALVLGGSLAVQVSGASSSTSSQKDEKNVKKSDDEVIEDKQDVDVCTQLPQEKTEVTQQKIAKIERKFLVWFFLALPSKEKAANKNMAQLCKLELHTQIKSSPSMFYDIYYSKTSLQPKIVPGRIRSIQVLEGDGKSVGSVRLWTYVMGNHPVITKDRIDYVDEQNKRITFDIIGGDIINDFKSFKATLEANVDTKIVKWTLEYEKANEDVPAPTGHLEFLVNLAKDVDSYLLKEQN